MQTQVASEAVNSARYVENYLDCVENVPNDIQRYLTRIRELDVQYRNLLRESKRYYQKWTSLVEAPGEADSTAMAKTNRAMTRIQNCLISAQELGDEKLQVVTQLQEMIELKTRQLDNDLRALDYNKDEAVLEPPQRDNVVIPVPAPFTPSIVPSTVGLTPIATAASVLTTTNNTTNDRFPVAAPASSANTERTSKRVRRSRTDTVTSAIDQSTSDTNTPIDTPVPAKQGSSSSNNSGAHSTSAVQAGNKKNVAAAKKKKRKAGGRSGAVSGGGAAGTSSNSSSALANSRDVRNDTPPPEETIDPDEPTYCLCDQISFGEMILCDNDLCPIEWFHFSCVSLMSKPKGKWFCPNCRGDRPNVMKPKQQFLKELERYNKEKEEKT